jgi:hypothetical protein
MKNQLFQNLKKNKDKTEYRCCKKKELLLILSCRIPSRIQKSKHIIFEIALMRKKIYK